MLSRSGLPAPRASACSLHSTGRPHLSTARSNRSHTTATRRERGRRHIVSPAIPRCLSVARQRAHTSHTRTAHNKRAERCRGRGSVAKHILLGGHVCCVLSLCRILRSCERARGGAGRLARYVDPGPAPPFKALSRCAWPFAARPSCWGRGRRARQSVRAPGASKRRQRARES